ncbi:MAG: hypothetical protein IMZ51_03845 [Chloroflexi bacterium]|nr:hypothetical protein [Chloroflexota bacterium]
MMITLFNNLKESMDKIMFEDDEGENEGLKAIREHEDCTDFDEQDKYDILGEAENQENFCN